MNRRYDYKDVLLTVKYKNGRELEFKALKKEAWKNGDLYKIEYQFQNEEYHFAKWYRIGAEVFEGIRYLERVIDHEIYL